MRSTTKQALMAAGVTASVAFAGMTGLGAASAATQSGSETSPMSSLVTAVANKFNLKESDVQAVFDEQHSAMEAQRETRAKEDVAALVKDGKLTQAQADLINAKRSELEKERESNRATDNNASREDMKAKMDTKRTELDKWFSDNNIPTEYRYLVFGGMHGGPGGRGGGHHGRQIDGNDENTSSSSSSKSTESSSSSSSSSN